MAEDKCLGLVSRWVSMRQGCEPQQTVAILRPQSSDNDNGRSCNGQSCSSARGWLSRRRGWLSEKDTWTRGQWPRPGWEPGEEAGGETFVSMFKTRVSP